MKKHHLGYKIYHLGYRHCWHIIDYKYAIIEHGSPEYNQYQKTPVIKCCFCPKTKDHDWGTQLISQELFEEATKGVKHD